MSSPSRFSVLDAIPPPGAYRCNGGCGAVLERFGVCDPCGARRAQREHDARIRGALRREIPPEFAWASWDAPELAERVAGGASTVRRARAALSTHRGVLVGGAGAGKSSLAVAWLRERIEAGDERCRFVAAHDLGGPSYLEGVSRIDLAISAHRLVLDDLGEELASAPAGGGIFAQRVEAVVRLIRTRHDQGLGTVVTTGRALPWIAERYGDGIARRVFERVPVLNLEGASAPP